MTANWPDSREFWSKRRVCVTGGAGFLGSFIVEKLRGRGAHEIFVPLIEDRDLTQVGNIKRTLADVEILKKHVLGRQGVRGRNSDISRSSQEWHGRSSPVTSLRALTPMQERRTPSPISVG